MKEPYALEMLHRGRVLRGTAAIVLAASISACAHHGSSVLPATGASSAATGFSALAKARQINPKLCTFSATGHFDGDVLKGGTTTWFNSSMGVSGNGFNVVNIYVTSSNVTFTSKDGTQRDVSLPDSVITIDPSAITGSVLFHDDVTAWHEVVPSGIPGYFFSNGGRYAVPSDLRNVKDATWSAIISTDTPGISLTWRWAAQAYTTLGLDYNGMGVKPMDSATTTAYQNDDDAGTPENFKSSLAHGGGNGAQDGPDDRWTGHFTQPVALTPCQLGAPGAGPTPTPAPTPIPPGQTPGPTPTPNPNMTPTPTPSPVTEPAHAAFVPNFNDNDVSVIDTTLHRVVGTISVGNAPYGVAVDSATSSVYVGNEYSATVSVIDSGTGQVPQTIGVGLTPYGIAVNPTGTRAYVATNDGSSVGSIAIIDAGTQTVTQMAAPAGALPFMPAVSPDGSRVYVGNLGTASVSIYDATNNSYLNDIPISSSANGMAISPDGGTLYVCDGGLSYVSTITQTQTAFQPISGGCADVALNASGTIAYVTSNFGSTTSPGSLSVINTATHAVLATVRVGILPEGVAVSPSGTEVYVANAASNSVSVVSTVTNAVTNTIAVGNGPYAFGNFLK